MDSTFSQLRQCYNIHGRGSVITMKLILPSKAFTPFTTKYYSEIDKSAELEDHKTRFCQEIVCMLR